MLDPATRPAADRNLLFGILALQMDFIQRDALVAGMHAWVLAKKKSLGQILVEQKALGEDRRVLLETLVQEHLKLHANDAEKSLAAVPLAARVRDELKQITDPDIEASIARLPTARAGDESFATRAPSVGTLTSSGLRFRIVRPHRKGGLGEVYVAVDEELHREVALKEIQSHFADSVESRTRFLVEAEITGGLEHPGIVPVYGLGQYSGDGRPYYAMRFIRGDSLKDAIDQFYKEEGAARGSSERTLQFRQLLGRFVDVCHAIAYAHSRGVLHRDLKPANIMLGQFGETLVVDWGLAKPIDQPEGSSISQEGSLKPSSLSSTSVTQMGAAIGTPQYMSPEQAAGRHDKLRASSDVYSLGATLYCLLTGKAPFNDPDVGVILERVQRGVFPRPREVKPDVDPALEAICLKAMARIAPDRYASAQLLADDIEHWLADEPVSAWPEPWTIKVRRWVSRHRTLVTAAAATVLVAATCLSAATVLLAAANDRERRAKQLAEANEREAAEQRDQARTQKEKAERNFQLARQAVDRYHTDVSESVLLNEPGMEPLRKKLLEAASEFYQKFTRERAGDAGVQGELGMALFRLAQITSDVGNLNEALKLHQQALEKFEAVAAGNPEYQDDRAACNHHLGRLYRLTDQTAKAESAYKDALELWQKLVGDHSGDPRLQAGLARTWLGLGNEYRLIGRTDEAAHAYQQALDIWSKLTQAHPASPEYQRYLAVSNNNLAQVFGNGQAGKAEAAVREAVRIQEKLVRDYPNITQYRNDLARSHFNLGNWHARAGQPDKANADYKEAETVWLGLIRDHPAVTEFHANLAALYNNWGNTYRAAGPMNQAVDAYQKALAIQEKLARDHADRPSFQSELARFYHNLAEVHRSGRKLPEAEQASAKALAIRDRLAREHADMPQYQNDLAESHNELGLLRVAASQPKLAGPSFEKARDLWKGLAGKHPQTPEFALGLGACCNSLGSLAKDNANASAAVERYSEAIEAVEPLAQEKFKQAEARQTLRNAYWGRAEALTKLNRHQEALQDWDRAMASDLEHSPRLRLHRAAALARTGQHAQAIAEAVALAKGTAQGDALYQLACVYALSAAAVQKDAGLTTPARDQLSEQHASQAVQLLARAFATGYFKDPVTHGRLLSDPELEPLRNRVDFQKLVKG